MFLVAVLVLLFLMYRFYTFRAEMVFIMTLLTPAMLLIGAYHLTGEYREAGIFLLIVGIFLLAVVMFMYRITARGVERNSDLLIIRICLFMVHSDFFRHFAE